jgi:hypothetical protein
MVKSGPSIVKESPSTNVGTPIVNRVENCTNNSSQSACILQILLRIVSIYKVFDVFVRSSYSKIIHNNNALFFLKQEPRELPARQRKIGITDCGQTKDQTRLFANSTFRLLVTRVWEGLAGARLQKPSLQTRSAKARTSRFNRMKSIVLPPVRNHKSHGA